MALCKSMAVMKYNTMPDAMTTCLITESNMQEDEKAADRRVQKPISEGFEFYPVENVTTDICRQEVLAHKSMKIT